MLLLMEWPWIWVGMGVALILWGSGLLGFRLREWAAFLVRWVLDILGDNTKAEKKRLKEMSFDEEVVASPGCGLAMVGVMFVVYGLMRIML